MSSTIASMEFSLQWKCEGTKHCDRLYFPKIDFWKDFFPDKMDPFLDQLEKGELITVEYDPGRLVEPFDAKKVYRILKGNLKTDPAFFEQVEVGRFYPRGLFKGIGFDTNDVRPLRVLNKEGDAVRIDCNHPLSRFPLTLSGQITESLAQKHLRGGSSQDISYLLTQDGPGLQADNPEGRLNYNESSFERQDTSPDPEFYSEPRLVTHVDDQASQIISSIYARHIKPGMKVLDLMAAWSSHLKGVSEDIDVTGLGMNEEEMRRNNRINQVVYQDLNAAPTLPFADESFDVVICSVSIEYLTHPVAVLKEVGRVLKKSAPFITTVSDRWFEPKVIRIWPDLHAYERLGLVSRFYQDSGIFTDLNTETVRGYPRPEDDKHYPQRNTSDPVFAVWGVKE